MTTPDSYLSKDGANVVVSQDNSVVFRIPVQNLESINTFAYQGASPGLMKLCVDNNVALSFFSPSGRFIARIQGPVTGNILLRHKQFHSFNDPDFCLRLAQISVASKIANARTSLRRFVRDYPDNDGIPIVTATTDQLKRSLVSTSRTNDIDELRGIEGEAAALYFSVFDKLILSKADIFYFSTRNRRPPRDPVNAMLSFGYAILTNDCVAALEGVGLDPQLGFMHSMRPGRKSLALDLMEEFRSYIVDRLVLSMINMKQISKADFTIHYDELDKSPTSVLLNDDGRKKYIEAWQKKKKKEIEHPFLGEKVQIGLLPYLQAQLLSRYLRGDLDDYPAFLSK